MRIGICGSAGRKDDRAKITPDHYRYYYEFLKKQILAIEKDGEVVTLVSGGAAWMDHCAVGLFLDDSFLPNQKKLELHFPCEWDERNKRFYETGNKDDCGSTANYYHHQFSLKMSNNASMKLTLASIDKALGLPGASNTVSDGFHARDLLIGKVNRLFAATFGTSGDTHTAWPEAPEYRDGRLAGLKPGGTEWTWNHSNANTKTHLNLAAHAASS